MYDGNNQQAAEELHHAASLNPTALPAWESMAALQLNMGDVVEAAETFEKLVSIYVALLCIQQPCLMHQPISGA